MTDIKNKHIRSVRRDTGSGNDATVLRPDFGGKRETDDTDAALICEKIVDRITFLVNRRSEQEKNDGCLIEIAEEPFDGKEE